MPSDATIARRTLLSGLAALAACNDTEDAEPRSLSGEVREFLLGATTFELVAVHPAIASATAKPHGAIDVVHEHGVMGRAALDVASERSEVVDWIDKAVASRDGTVAACFKPRHGVTATRDSERMDLLICFECHSMLVYKGADKPISYLIGRAGESELTALFRKHGFTIAS